MLTTGCGRIGFDELRSDGGDECLTQTLQVSGQTDDGEIDITASEFLPDGEILTIPPGLYIDQWSGDPTWGFFRFALNNTLPDDAQVMDVRLRLWGVGSINWDAGLHALTIHGEEAPFPGAPEVNNANNAPNIPISGRPRYDCAGSLA